MTLLDRYHAALAARLYEQRDDTAQGLVNGLAADYPAYKEKAAVVRTLNEVIKAMDEVRNQLLGKEADDA